MYLGNLSFAITITIPKSLVYGLHVGLMMKQSPVSIRSLGVSSCASPHFKYITNLFSRRCHILLCVSGEIFGLNGNQGRWFETTI